jgi:hypothetical protein
MGMAVLQRPVADLGTIELEVVEAQGLGGDEAVGARGEQSRRLMSRSTTGCGQALE